MVNFFKSISAIAAITLCGIPAFAQSSSNPLVLNPDQENYYEAGSEYADVYYEYTAPENQLVFLDGLRSYGVTCQGEYVNNVSYAYPTPATVFYAENGKTYLIDGYTNTQTFVKFTPQITSSDLNNGQDSANPIIGSSDLTYLPCCKDGDGWMAPTLPVYVQYTATEAGKLAISFPVAPSSFTNITDGANISLEPQYVSDTQLYRTTMQVEAGQTVLFKANNSSPVVAYFTIEQSIPGASQEDAFPTQFGENQIPAAAGTYWYIVNTPSTPANGFLTVSSDAEGTLFICGSTGGILYTYPYIGCRKDMSANSTRYLKIVKENDTAEAETFNLAFDYPQPFDSFDTAEEIETATPISTPQYDGKYYYKLTAPENESYLLDVYPEEGSENGYEFALFLQTNDWSYLTRGKTIHYATTPGEVYILRIECSTDQRGLTFAADFSEIQPGMAATNPIVAHVGDNEAISGIETYYSFTPEESKWIVVEMNGMVAPQVYSDGSTYVYTYAVGENSVRWEGIADTAYTIRFDNVGEDASFNISLQDYAAGESFSNPLEANVGENVLPEEAGKTWFKYNVENTGFIIVTTNLAYNYSTDIEMYINEVTPANRIPMGYTGYYDYVYTQIKKPVTADDVIYIMVKTSSARDNNWIKIENNEAGPGESPNTAFDFNFEPNEDGEVTLELPEIASGSEVWYKFTLTDGGLLSTVTYYSTNGALFAEDGSTQLASITYNYSNYSYGFNRINVLPGTYYMCYTSSVSAQTATWTLSQPAPGESMSTAIVIPVTGDPTTYEFENKPTDISTIWFALDLQPGTLTMHCPSWWIRGEFKNSNNEFICSIIDHGGDDYGFNELEITEAGTYYLSLYTLYAGTATFTGTALIDPVNVEFVNADRGDVEYFTLQGRKVIGQPEAGIYIVKQGNKTSKVVIR